MQQMHRVKQTLGDIVELSGKEGRNSKAEIKELAFDQLEDLSPERGKLNQKNYNELRDAGVCHTKSIVAKDWIEQDRHELIRATRKYLVDKERIREYYTITFLQLKQKYEEID